ncbi:MAG: VWA domain-containing protein [Vicinamibacterales bacterium]
MKTTVSVLVLCGTLVATSAGQDGGSVAVTIVSPDPDAFVSGTVRLAARIEPSPRIADVSHVLFYADGRLVCTIVEPAQAECPWDAGSEITEHVIRVVAQLKAGGRVVSSARTKKLDHAESVHVEVVQITAVVSDRNRFVKGLAPTAFRLKEDGVPQSIQHFSSEGSPLELIVAIDVSGSMSDAMPQLKNAVRRFLSALGPKDQVTLAAFNDSMFTLARSDANPTQRLRAVDRLAPWGGTALYDVIVRSVQLLSKQAGRRVLVVFSDGDDRSSHATIETVETAIRANDATLFMVVLGRGVRERQLRSGIERLVELSGGRLLFVERSDQLSEPFTEIIEELSNQYLIGYESTNARRDGKWREIELDILGQDFTVRARQGYKAPGK